ncbi:hypothetical protein ACFV8T_44875 [Streptomyces sp. NPDC059832]|uniref:hypothetical protein n=1 Tax=Streptomyces sp. NPDC059832 TaxID=3346966 RepID=UPI003659425D
MKMSQIAVDPGLHAGYLCRVSGFVDCFQHLLDLLVGPSLIAMNGLGVEAKQDRDAVACPACDFDQRDVTGAPSSRVMRTMCRVPLPTVSSSAASRSYAAGLLDFVVRTVAGRAAG